MANILFWVWWTCQFEPADCWGHGAGVSVKDYVDFPHPLHCEVCSKLYLHAQSKTNGCMTIFVSEDTVETCSRRVTASMWWCTHGGCQLQRNKWKVQNYLFRIASPHHVSYTLQMLHPSMTLSFPMSEDVCGMNFLFSFLFCSPSFIPLDFGSDHFDLILSFDSLRWSFAMPVAYNPISVMAGEVLIATRKRLNLTKLRNPSCTVSQCAATHSGISGGLPYHP